MMTTLELLFRDIPGALYEPIYYTALAAVILVFWPKRIRDVRAFCFLGAVFIMVLWRLLIQIISSRYSLLLIYPAIFGALFSCKTVAEVLYDRIPGIRRYGSSRGIAYFFLGLLLLASLLRFCMINPYWETLQKAARTVREDVQNNEALIWSNSINDVPRFRFYSKLPVLPLGIELKQQIAVLDEAVEPGKRYYFYLHESVSQLPFEKRLPADALRNGTLKKLFSDYVNSKKRVCDHVYVYTNFNQLRRAAEFQADASRRNLLKNGGFSRCEEPVSAAEKTAHWREKGFEFYSETDFHYPQGGYFAMVPNPVKGEKEYPRMSLILEPDSRYLRIQAGKISGYWIFSDRFGMANYQFAARVRGTPGAELVLFANLYRGSQWLENRKIVRFTIPEGQGVFDLIGLMRPAERDQGAVFYPGLYVLNGTVEISQVWLENIDTTASPE